jgi:hypothetical protein
LDDDDVDNQKFKIMKNFITIAVLMAGSITGIAQDASIQWQNTIGGSELDLALALTATDDGGFIVAGTSESDISGDKTEDSNGGLDLWIVKLNDMGQIAWQNTIGGNGDDYALSIEQTTDGGYIVGAGSDSDISGDKTENSRGGLDYWILKLDSAGDIEWQRTYGGDAADFDARVVQTSDGGYFAGGYSDSSVSGDKTDPSNGQRDFWAIKMDSSGDIVWQNSIGGSLIDRPQAAFETSDGGFLMAGGSTSNISGDKTENAIGDIDYWVVKLDSNGVVQWDNTIGGNDLELVRHAIQTSDNGYLIGGYSKSDASGDKTEDSQGVEDYWVVKLNEMGEITWQNTIGGSAIDFLTNVAEIDGGGFLISGYSNSNASGDKMDDSNGGYDLWILRLDSSGGLGSQNTLGGSGDESRAFLQQLPGTNYIIACTSDSPISGDKDEDSEGLEDYWVFLADASLLGISENNDLLKPIIFPNPSQGHFTIDLGATHSQWEVQVHSVLGKLVASERFYNTSRATFGLNLSSGIYSINIRSSEGKTMTLKLIKQ